MFNKRHIFGGLIAILFSTGACAEEIRVGALKHDVGSGLHHRYEKGYDINAEFIWNPFIGDIADFIFNPAPHVGASINTEGATDQLYFGVTWRIDALNPFFIELSFGGSINDGRTSTPSSKKNALGSNIMFREGASVGLMFLENHSVSVLLDHTSNARLANKNPGLTGLGVRYGYRW
jgi:lipid A 3-O-deacylase